MRNPWLVKHKDILLIIAFVLFSSFALYIPFFLNLHNWFGIEIKEPGLNNVYRHFDGLLYIVPAKTFYNKEAIQNLHLELSLPTTYFAAHLPLYPIFIKLFSIILGYLKSMIIVNLFFSILLALFLYYILRSLKLTDNPLMLITVFLFLPRFFVVRSIGAPESLFMLLIISSLYFFEKKDYLLAGLMGGLSVMTKTPGMLLLIAYFLVFLESFWKHRKFELRWLYILLIPVGLLGVFSIYAVQFKDFFAYFHSGDNIHLVFPFSVFNYQKTWVGSGWLEEIIFYFFLYLFTIIQLKDTKYRSFFYFSVVFFIATIFVQHRDIARYSLPLWPLACIANEKYFTSKKFVLALLILIPAIYLYAFNFLMYNTMPVSDWTAFV